MALFCLVVVSSAVDDFGVADGVHQQRLKFTRAPFQVQFRSNNNKNNNKQHAMTITMTTPTLIARKQPNKHTNTRQCFVVRVDRFFVKRKFYYHACCY